MGITVLTHEDARIARRVYAPCSNGSSVPEMRNSIASKLREHPLPYPVALAECVRCRTQTGEDVQGDDFGWLLVLGVTPFGLVFQGSW